MGAQNKRNAKAIIKDIFLRKTTKNSLWIIGEQAIQMLCGLLLTILVSRYLGPENYGILSYGTTLVSFFGIIAKLGIDTTIVNELIENKDNEEQILGTSIVLRLASSLISIFILSITVFILRTDSPVVITVSIIESVTIIFQCTNLFTFWFQSKLQSKYTAIAKLIAYLIVVFFKIALLYFHASIYWFAISTLLESFLILVASFIIYKYKSKQKLHFNKQIAINLLKKSYHFIISGILVYIYTQTDKIMIAQILNDTELGYYSAALNICTTCLILPEAIMTSLKVSVFNAKKTSSCYLKKLKQAYAILFYTSITISVIITITSQIIISILYGVQYTEAITTLRILIWFIPFSTLGSARGMWIISENKNIYAKKYAIIGVILNIILNSILIPKIDINGAALATVTTEIVTCFIAPLLFKQTRTHTRILTEALLLKFNTEINTEYCIRKIIGKISPTLLSKILYKKTTGKKLNLKNPKTLNEKLMWLKINNYNKNPLVWQCADKYEVRKYIESRGIPKKNLPKIIKIYNNASEINFDDLPNKFALKCTHGSGFNIICTDKKNLNIDDTKKQLQEWQKTNFGITTAEPHYNHIKPKIISEEFIKSKQNSWPIDYKFFCFNGNPVFIIAHIDRETKQRIASYDIAWTRIITCTNEDKKLEIQKPKSFKKMLEISKILSSDFPFVRVDFYEKNNTAIVGEMTFTPAACLANWTEEASKKYGELLDIK